MIILICGEDKFIINETIKKAKKNFTNLEPGINYIKIDNNNINSLLDEIETPAFGYDRKLIIIKDSGLFNKNNLIASKVAKFLENNKSEDIIIFVEKNINDKNDLYKIISKIGKIVELKEQNITQIISFIKAYTNNYNVEIDNFLANYLIELCGTKLEDIIIELQKVIDYKKQGKIKKEDIDKIVIKKVESIIFELTDNLGKKNIEKALEVFYNLLENREVVQRIFGMLYYHFRKLYIVKLSNREDLIKNLNLKSNQTFLIRKYEQQANYFKLDELEEILEKFIELDEKFKIGDIDLKIGLETIMCRYCIKEKN